MEDSTSPSTSNTSPTGWPTPAVPGEATVQVRLQDRKPGEAVAVRFLEIPPEGEVAAPAWVQAKPTAEDPDFFLAPMPLMTFGVWTARVAVSGDRGEGVVEIPVAATVPAPGRMGGFLGTLLAGALK